MNVLNYIGSKRTLCNTIYNIINKTIINNNEELNNMSFLDLFAGTGSISFFMKKYVKFIGANDLEYYSFIILNALLKTEYNEQVINYIQILNNLNGKNGLVSKNYSPNQESNCERMFFTSENANLCDSMREYINNIYSNKQINNDEYYFLLASLLISMDSVANTSCVYGAYLKKFKSSSQKKLFISPIHSLTYSDENITQIQNNKVYNKKAEDLLLEKDFYYDIVYLDPPYNQRQYAANYSPLNYIAHYDSNINLTGKTGLIKNYNKSDFCSKPKVKLAFKTLFDRLKGKCKYVYLSYNNEGLLSYEDLITLLKNYGSVSCYKIPYKKFKAQQNVDKLDVMEYLWFIDLTKNIGDFIEINYE
jgi:adenine-specific DNA-methyltransferase